MLVANIGHKFKLSLFNLFNKHICLNLKSEARSIQSVVQGSVKAPKIPLRDLQGQDYLHNITKNDVHFSLLLSHYYAVELPRGYIISNGIIFLMANDMCACGFLCLKFSVLSTVNSY